MASRRILNGLQGMAKIVVEVEEEARGEEGGRRRKLFLGGRTVNGRNLQARYPCQC